MLAAAGYIELLELALKDALPHAYSEERDADRQLARITTLGAATLPKLESTYYALHETWRENRQKAAAPRARAA